MMLGNQNAKLTGADVTLLSSSHERPGNEVTTPPLAMFNLKTTMDTSNGSLLNVFNQ
jgi:hypothetical protein